MTEEEWLRGNSWKTMIARLDSVSWRQAFLFPCACYRRMWLDLKPNEQRAILKIEEYVEGKINAKQLKEFCRPPIRDGIRWLPTEPIDFYAALWGAAADLANWEDHHEVDS